MSVRNLMHRAMYVLAFILSGVLAGAGLSDAVAQASAQSYTSQFTGSVIEATAPWSIDLESSGPGDGVEVIAALGQFDGVLISYMPSGIDLVMARDFMLDEYSSFFENVVPIDKGAYGSVSYSLDMASADGIEFGMFSLFLGERPSGYVEYYLYFGPAAYFQQGFSTAQQSITVDGTGIFENVDGAGLQSFLTQNAGATGGTSVAPDGNVASGGDQQQAPAPTAETTIETPAEDGTSYIAALRAEMEYLQGSISDFVVNFAALQGDGVDQAVSEINRISAEWSNYSVRAGAIVAPAGFEEIDAAFQALAGDVDTLGASWLSVVTALQSGVDADVNTAISDFTSGLSTVQGQVNDLIALLDSYGAVETPAPPEVPTEVAPTPEPSAEPTKEVATSTSGSSKGGSKGTAGSSKKNETETGQGDQGNQSVTNEELGLTGEGEYVSPQHGVEILWDDAWYFSPTFENLLRSDAETGFDSLPITWAGGDTVYILNSLSTSEGLTPVDMAEYWASADYLAKNADPNAEILLHETGRSGSAAILMRDYLDDGTEIIILKTAMCPDAACELLLVSSMFSLPESTADAYADGRSGIEINGERLFDVFTPRQITAALEG